MNICCELSTCSDCAKMPLLYIHCDGDSYYYSWFLKLSSLWPFTKLKSTNKDSYKKCLISGLNEYQIYAAYIRRKCATWENESERWFELINVTYRRCWALQHAECGESEASHFMTPYNFTRDNLEIQSVISFPESFRARSLLRRGVCNNQKAESCQRWQQRCAILWNCPIMEHEWLLNNTV